MAKGASSEQEVSVIHKGITRIFTKQQERMFELLEEGVDPLALADPKIYKMWMEWCKQNEVGLALNEEDELDILRNNTKDIKDKSSVVTNRLMEEIGIRQAK